MITAPSLNHVTVTETKIYISVQVYLGPKKGIPPAGSEKGWEKTDMPNKIKSHIYTASCGHHSFKT